MIKVLFILITIINVVSCNFTVFNSQSNLKSSSTGGVASNTSFNVDGIVQGLEASKGLWTDKINIKWNNYRGASLYNISRAKVSIQDFSMLNDELIERLEYESIAQVEGNEYIDTVSNEDEKYYAYFYKVSCTNTLTNETTKLSNAVIGTYLTAPRDIQVSKGNYENKIKITFSRVPYEENYYIFSSYDNTRFQTKIATINSTNDVIDYEFDVQDNPNFIYFKIQAFRPEDTNTVSALSNCRIGYCKNLNQTSTIQEFYSNKGFSSDKINLNFTLNDENNLDYIITRYSSESDEKIILNTSTDGTSALEENDGLLKYYDTDRELKTNFEYTYSLIPISNGEKYTGSITRSYLLSPVISAKLKPIKDGKFGYNLVVTPPVGFVDNDKIEIEIRSTYKNGDSKIKNFKNTDFIDNNSGITSNDIKKNFAFYPVNKDSESDDEIRKLEIRAININSVAYSSTNEIVIRGTPDAPSILVDGKNIVLTDENNNVISKSNILCTNTCSGKKYHDGAKCYEYGTYPIILKWTQSDGSAVYKIKRNDGREYATHENSLQDKFVEVGKKYNYAIFAEDDLGRYKNALEINDCFAAITPAQFLSEYERHLSGPYKFQDEHPEYSSSGSKGSIWNFIRKEGLGSLGTASATDDFLKGTLTYSCKLDGFSGLVKLEYTPGYGECDYMHFLTNEEMNKYGLNLEIPQITQFKANMFGDGDYTPNNNQKHYVGGIYGLGIIDSSEVETKLKNLDGKYSVSISYNKVDSTKLDVTEKVIPSNYKIER